MKVGILTSSVREGRKSLDVAQWVLKTANNRNDEGVTYEIVDIKDFDLGLFGTNLNAEQQADVAKFSNKISEFDAFVFTVAEYNHGLTGAFKNALDYLMKELNDKVVGYVGYGGVGGARAIEQLRMINAEQQMATVRRNVNLLLAHDFENFTTFKPQAHQADALGELLNQLLLWGRALKTIR